MSADISETLIIEETTRFLGIEVLINDCPFLSSPNENHIDVLRQTFANRPIRLNRVNNTYNDNDLVYVFDITKGYTEFGTYIVGKDIVGENTLDFLVYLSIHPFFALAENFKSRMNNFRLSIPEFNFNGIVRKRYNHLDWEKTQHILYIYYHNKDNIYERALAAYEHFPLESTIPYCHLGDNYVQSLL